MNLTYGLAATYGSTFAATGSHLRSNALCPDRVYRIAPRPKKAAAAILGGLPKNLGGLPKNLGRLVGHAREPRGAHVNRCSQKSRILVGMLYPHHLREEADFRKLLCGKVFLYSLLYFI